MVTLCGVWTAIVSRLTELTSRRIDGFHRQEPAVGLPMPNNLVARVVRVPKVGECVRNGLAISDGPPYQMTEQWPGLGEGPSFNDTLCGDFALPAGRHE